jgi:hypothetical protein
MKAQRYRLTTVNPKSAVGKEIVPVIQPQIAGTCTIQSLDRVDNRLTSPQPCAARPRPLPPTAHHCYAQHAAALHRKSFWFFFSKKNRFLRLLTHGPI